MTALTGNGPSTEPLARVPGMGDVEEPGDEAEHREAWRRERAQVDRALEAVSTALYRLNEAGDRVREARRWWAPGIAFGGGGIFRWSRMKASAADASRSLRPIDLALGDLRAELARLTAVHVEEAPEAAGGSGKAVGDWLVAAWFEVLFQSVLMNRRLRNAADRIEATGLAVVRLQSALGRRRAWLEDRLAEGPPSGWGRE